jgi:alpha,alpha-trehalase
MWEKYNVVESGANPEVGLYGSVAGFGWSHAVFVDFSRHLTTASTESKP